MFEPRDVIDEIADRRGEGRISRSLSRTGILGSGKITDLLFR
jgi:hypothetical protein